VTFLRRRCVPRNYMSERGGGISGESVFEAEGLKLAAARGRASSTIYKAGSVSERYQRLTFSCVEQEFVKPARAMIVAQIYICIWVVA